MYIEPVRADQNNKKHPTINLLLHKNWQQISLSIFTNGSTLKFVAQFFLLPTDIFYIGFGSMGSLAYILWAFAFVFSLFGALNLVLHFA